MDIIKVAIADDEALFRRGMNMILSAYENLDVFLEAKNKIWPVYCHCDKVADYHYVF